MNSATEMGERGCSVESQPGLHMKHFLMILHAWFTAEKWGWGLDRGFYMFTGVHTLNVNDLSMIS